MIRPGYEQLMPNLLRAAPYIDAEKLREQMTKEALDQLVVRAVPDSSSISASIRAFAEGESHTLPERYGLIDILFHILHRECPRPDESIYSAHDQYINYFFRSNYDLGI